MVQMQGFLLILVSLLVVTNCYGQLIGRRLAEMAASGSQRVTARRQHHYSEVPASQQRSMLPPRRQLQLNNNTVTNFTEPCSLCSGFPFRENAVPPPYEIRGVPPNATCGELDSLFSLSFAAEYSETSACLAMQALFSAVCCQFPAAPYVCEQNVRSTLLENYDSSIMPLPQDTGILKVEVLIDLLHISELSTKMGYVNVFVWIHFTWKDPRLAWEVSETNCTTSITTRASVDVERTEIYVPDIDLLNQVGGGTQAFPDAMATVYNDGTVVWRRNGPLKAFCFFTGLNRFPFDTLGCSFVIGGWVREHQVELVLGGPNGNGWTAGNSLERIIYNEYTLKADRTESGYLLLPSKHLVFYNLYFERSSRYYVLKVLLPTIVFTILSFGVFFLDLRVGERLTYGLTVLLVIIAQDISTSDLLPITDERLWINTFVVGSFYWVLLVNLESVFVAYLYFLGEDDDHQKNDSQPNEKKNGTAEPTPEPNEKDEHSGAYAVSSEVPDSSEHKVVSFRDDVKSETPLESDDNASAQSADRRAGFVRTATQRVVESPRRFLTFRQLLVQRNEPAKKRHRTIKRIDAWAFWILSISYVLFVVIMFATNSLWTDGADLYTERSD